MVTSPVSVCVWTSMPSLLAVAAVTEPVVTLMLPPRRGIAHHDAFAARRARRTRDVDRHCARTAVLDVHRVAGPADETLRYRTR
jgi:hypothetical protein